MNYRIKNIILGIGIGLVLASIININQGHKGLTIEEVKREAARYNLIVLDASEIMNTTPTPNPVPSQK